MRLHAPSVPRLTLSSARALVLCGAALGSACLSNAAPPRSTPLAPESVWRSLDRPRPEPLTGAPRISLSDLTLVGTTWLGNSPVSPGLGLHELVAAGLIRRRDVHFVERRRFAAQAEREARGLPPPKNAPRVGISPGADLLLAGSWIAADDSASLDLRLVDVESGVVATAWRVLTPQGVDPTSLARVVVGSTLAALAQIGRLPRWADPLANADADPAPARVLPSGVPYEAALAFFRGVEAEDRFDWEAARLAYLQAMELGGSGFFEPEAALARVARLRAGGTLGGSDR